MFSTDSLFGCFSPLLLLLLSLCLQWTQGSKIKPWILVTYLFELVCSVTTGSEIKPCVPGEICFNTLNAINNNNTMSGRKKMAFSRCLFSLWKTGAAQGRTHLKQTFGQGNELKFMLPCFFFLINRQLAMLL